MLHAMALVTLLLSAADHWTTYVCLREPLAGWVVTEANPIADWLFTSLGLVPGLLFDSAATLGAIAFLITTRRLSSPLKVGILSVISFWTGYAVVNNTKAALLMGLSLFGPA